MLVPDGQTFASAPSVLCGNVVPENGYQTDHPGPNAVDGFIADDIVNTRKDNPDAVITELDAAISADGHKQRIFTVRKLKGGHSQILTYTEDGDKDGKFFVVLMLDSKTDQALETDTPAFRLLVSQYKHWKAS